MVKKNLLTRPALGAGASGPLPQKTLYGSAMLKAKPHSSCFIAALSVLVWVFLPVAAQAQEVQPPGEGGFTLALAKTAGALAVVLLTLLALYWAGKKFLPKAVGARGGAMKIVGRMPLGARKQVVLLKVAGKVLVLGVAGDSINTLATLETPEELAGLGLSPKDFDKALSRAGHEEEPG